LPLVLSDQRTRRRIVSFTDGGTAASGRRHGFQQLLDAFRSGEADTVIAGDLSRLIRSHSDREQLDEALEAGASVIAVREGIDTADSDGRSRYDELAHLLVLAYEGRGIPPTPDDEDQSCFREALAGRFVTDVLQRLLELWRVPDELISAPLDDVHARLRALVARWGRPEVLPILAPYLDLAEWHEPTQVDVKVRALATLAVRNSRLEDLHAIEWVNPDRPPVPGGTNAACIRQSDWRVITQAAAFWFRELVWQPGDAELSPDDPFAGFEQSFPTAWKAFEALAALKPGAEWNGELPPPAVLPTLPEDEIRSETVRSVLDESGFLYAPSLTHLSRDPRALFHIVDVVLAHGGTIRTNNIYLSRELIRREQLRSPYDRLLEDGTR
jgi:hypothetical protein